MDSHKIKHGHAIYYGEPHSKDNQQTFNFCDCVHVYMLSVGMTVYPDSSQTYRYHHGHLFCVYVCVCVFEQVTGHRKFHPS